MSHIRNLYVKLVNAFISFLSIFIKRDKKNIMFGSWVGEKIADNSAYLMQYILDNKPNYNCFWVVSDKSVADDVNYPTVTFVKKNSLKQIICALKCGTFFVTHTVYTDISRYDCLNGAVTVDLGHGTFLKSLKHGYNSRHNYTYRIALGSAVIPIMLNVFENISEEKIIKTGFPRNDILLNATTQDIIEIKNRFAKKFNFDPNKKIITYMPTYRKSGAFKSVLDSDEQAKQIYDLLNKNNAVFIEKFHRTTLNQSNFAYSSDSNNVFINMDNSVESQELLLITDILIADYTSAVFDYCLLERPCIFYVYDYDSYKNYDQGLFFTIDEYSFGPVANDFSQLINSLEKTLNGEDEYHLRRKEINNLYSDFQSKNSSEKVFKRIFG